GSGVPLRRRTEEEIWQLVRERAVDRFTGAMQTFVGRCRKRNMDPDSVAQMIEAHSASSGAETLFLEVGVSIYAGYVLQLAERGNEDFDGLMWRAVSLIRGGQAQFVRDRGREQGD